MKWSVNLNREQDLFKKKPHTHTKSGDRMSEGCARQTFNCNWKWQ